ncbi:hypothetical protein B0I72DRAFT_35010 [Yarrowia lipolytica]|uniref:Uncharacterized protein n=1 Tax=Yarrowia lipolytica TaxID=4952 RepID=A0A371C4V9_YARLL|nr:hypothetical protein BKA91DRAFT_950 [Yarrowia lipolytica]KAE8174349.1 hypothetical protein BKA90DRAFT_42026 [Yarrowia lipolytica]RDW25020.1 hypothetical protein B0I71DRAFT_44658 [Yarrowia lipolytica]RDW32789.1 hypothetical protein B0I72DRAFT_35010 [Yarrowia lipolytica]RDW38997.1 hypothetical protein B0I73DRAFT_39548 [Yarrowia lipolytica]
MVRLARLIVGTAIGIGPSRCRLCGLYRYLSRSKRGMFQLANVPSTTPSIAASQVHAGSVLSSVPLPSSNKTYISLKSLS